jgi:hypothetical protein
MNEQYFLYTVTGLREPFYAAVDLETGRAWTSPTKDGALRQAKDAGIEGLVERTITRERFLRSLGIENEPAMRIDRHSGQAADSTQRQSKPSAGSWFVPGENAARDGGGPVSFPIPRRLKPGKKQKLKKGQSPFAGRPIAPPIVGGGNAPDDDVMIVPSSDERPAATPFNDESSATE